MHKTLTLQCTGSPFSIRHRAFTSGSVGQAGVYDSHHKNASASPFSAKHPALESGLVGHARACDAQSTKLLPSIQRTKVSSAVNVPLRVDW